MIDIGTGTPLVLVPGIQGRWEWMRPTVEALAKHFRVLSFSLAGERTSGQALDRRLGFDNFIVQIDRVLADAGVSGRGGVRRLVRRPHRGAVRGGAAATAACARPRVGTGAWLHAGRPGALLPARAVAAQPAVLRQRLATIPP